MAGFDPIKVDKDGKQVNVKWTTEAINKAIKGLEKGKKLVANPFYENKTYLLKADLVFTRTKEEVEEWKKCRDDILYFANKYCKLMTPEGIKNITLRDYQVEYLKHLQDNRLSIFLACRQCGKCATFLTTVDCQLDKENKNWQQVKKYWDSHYFISEDTYRVPLFELYNLVDKSFKWKIKYRLYKILYRLWLKEQLRNKSYLQFIYLIISLLDYNNRKSTEKLIKSFDIEGVKVKTDYGFSNITQIHETRPFYIYKLITRKGLVFEGADNHILFRPGHEEVFLKDLHPGDVIMTEYGDDVVKEVISTTTQVNMCDVTVDNPTHSYYTNHILSHNTTTSAIFMLWFILFNVDKNTLVLGNKRKTAVEILSKTKKIFEAIPFFLKPGVEKWNENEIVLDNGCMCMAEATTVNSGISFTFHCVLADEFAHIEPNIKTEFYKNLFPVITAGRARFMITSTQHGPDLFCQLYTGAVNGENEYKPFKVDWWQVPEWDEETHTFIPRTEDWHRMQVGNLGSEEAFQEQFGTNFAVANNSLIDGKILTSNSLRAKKFESIEIPGQEGAEFFKWDTDFDLYNMKNEFWTLTTDISEGIAQDYTVTTFNKIINVDEDGNVITKAMGMFKTNTKSDKECCNILYQFCSKWMNCNNYIFSLEYNLNGELWINNFKNIIDKENPNNFGVDLFVKYYNDNMTKFRQGVLMTAKSKQKACKLFKSDYEKGYIINDNVEFTNELRHFADKNGNGSYKASFGHDDMVMSQIQLTLTKESTQFKNLVEDYKLRYNVTDTSSINFYQDMGKPSWRIQEETRSNNIPLTIYDW